MKTNRLPKIRNYILLMMIVATGCIMSCKSKPEGRKIKLTLEINLDEFVRTMANHPEDSMLNRVLDATNAARQECKGSYINLITSTFKGTFPGVSLAALFTKTNEYAINANSKDEEVVNYLKKEAEIAMKRDSQILMQRMTSLGLTNQSMEIRADLGIIFLEANGAIGDSAEMCKFLSATGNLEFFETYTNEELASILMQIDELLAAKVVSEKTKNKADTNDLKELFKTKHPLFYIMMPSIDESNNFVNGPVVGRTYIKDTAKLNNILAQKMVRELLPANLKFVYNHLAKNDTVPCVYAIKVPHSGNAIINNEYITNAYSDKSQLTDGYEITIEMNHIGAVRWKEMTTRNIEHYIAVTLDGELYSCPRVLGTIPNGNTMVSGSFTKEQAAMLAAVLKCGKLPIPVRVTGKVEL